MTMAANCFLAANSNLSFCWKSICIFSHFARTDNRPVETEPVTGSVDSPVKRLWSLCNLLNIRTNLSNISEPRLSLKAVSPRDSLATRYHWMPLGEGCHRYPDSLSGPQSSSFCIFEYFYLFASYESSDLIAIAVLSLNFFNKLQKTPILCLVAMHWPCTDPKHCLPNSESHDVSPWWPHAFDDSILVTAT